MERRRDAGLASQLRRNAPRGFVEQESDRQVLSALRLHRVGSRQRLAQEGVDRFGFAPLGLRPQARRFRVDEEDRAHHRRSDEGGGDDRSRDDTQAVSSKELPRPVGSARRPRRDWPILEMGFEVGGEGGR